MQSTNEQLSLSARMHNAVYRNWIIAATQELEESVIDLARTLAENIDELVACNVNATSPDRETRAAAREATLDVRRAYERWDAASRKLLAAIAGDAT
jgi:hypothetical protein